MIPAAWSWLSASDAHVGTAVIVTAFAVFIACTTTFGIGLARCAGKPAPEMGESE